MLVLTRSPGEGVVTRCACGCEHLVVVVEVNGRKTRLGFDAPKSVRIWRDELGRPPEAGRADGGDGGDEAAGGERD